MTLVLTRGIRISDIRLLNPHVHTPLGRTKFYVEIKYNSKRKAKTMKKPLEGDCVCWEESISLEIADITDESMITFTVTKIHLFITETIASFQRNVVDLIHSGTCKLEICKDSQLMFNIEEMTDILPIMLDEALKSTNTQKPISGTSPKAVEDQENAWSVFLSRFEVFMNIIDAASALNPYAKLAWSILSLIPKTTLSQKGRNDCIGKLCEKLKEVYDYITNAERLRELMATQSKTLLLLVQQTIECAYFIREYGNGSIVGKVWRGGSIDDKIKLFNEKLDHYLSVITSSITLETGIVTLRIADTAAETKDLILMNEMPYARNAGFISEKRCLPGTRQHLVNKIVEWVNSDAPQRILVLSGQAGTGKSAVAHTIAEIFKKQNRLGSMFCFNRSYKDRCNLLFSTISRGLADSDVLWRESLVKIIQDTAIRTSMDPVTQFDELIAKPSKNVATVGPVVVVIDALDESGNRGERTTVLDLLFRRCSELPVNYRIIITSRPEQDIELLRDNPETTQCIRMGDIATDDTLSDIQSYVLNRLKPIAPTLNKIEENWSQILAKRAEGLFQWADTVCRFIDPDVRYSLIVRKRWIACVSSSSSSLYKLYEDIISSQRECEDSEFVENFKTIVSAIIMAREPLSVDALQNILQELIPDVREVLYPFGSLFLGVNDLFTPIQPLHTSLFDFFADSSNRYHVYTSNQGFFTLGCLKVMNRMLRFNICDLETSHLSNRDVPDFYERVTAAVPSHLLYACYFWALDLHFSCFTDNIVTEIRALMEEKLLFWFEVLSLLNDIEQGCSAMSILKDWSQGAGNDLATQASDACHFGLTCKEAMSGSTPHLYLSALPFAPRSSFISKQYLPRYPQLFSIDIDQSVDFTPTEIGVTKRHIFSVPISSLAFSPRDRYIASGFSNGEICLWDYKTGEQINQWKPEPNTQYGEISDIVFSPNGELVYGCFPTARRILIWNIKTNDAKQECYDSDIEEICRFSTISSDGQYIAFESYTDVLLYDRTRSLIIGRFDTRQSRGVLYSVHRSGLFLAKEKRCEFSPNGNLFAFIEKGEEANLWKTREQVLVSTWSNSCSLALSDSYIAVLKLNGCMEVWDLTAMKLVCNFANRDTTKAKAIQFSADNQYVLSFCDNIYCIWTLSTGELIHQSKANDIILDLALSPGLKYIALADSGDAGTTYIRQWTTRSLQQSSPDGLFNKNMFVRKLWLHGTYLVLVFHHDLLQIWDITTMNTIVFKSWTRLYSAVLAFSIQDVVYVAYGIERSDSNGFTDRYELRIWDSASKSQIILYKSPEDAVSALAFSESNNYLISGDSRGTLKIWDIIKRRFVGEPNGVQGNVTALSFSSSGTKLVIAYAQGIFEIRECQPGLPMRVLTGPFRRDAHSQLSVIDSIAFSANERHIVCISMEGAEILDAMTGKEVGWIECQEVLISGRKLSPDGKYFAWVKDHEVNLWDVDNNRLLLEDFSEGYNLCFSNDSTQLVTIAMTEDNGSKDNPMFDINVMSGADSDMTRACYYHFNIWDIQTREAIVKKVRYPKFKFYHELALHDGHIVLSTSDFPCAVWSLHVLSAAATLYDHYLEAPFGTFPVNGSEIVCDTSAPFTNSPSADNTDSNETLDYSLTAWYKALFSSFAQMDENGWVLGPHRELLFWVPKERRKGFWYPGMTHIATKNITRLNFDNFVHGTRWTECRGTL